MTGEKCIFCEIVDGREPASIIEQTDSLLVIAALEGGYPLIIPRRHIKDWMDPQLDDQTAAEIGAMQKKLAVAVQSAFNVPAVSILSFNGRESGQHVFHLHTHIIPRVAGDKLIITQRGEITPRLQLDSNARLLREALRP